MTYFISDMHGEYGLFLALLKKIGFSKKDQMYICGDIVDKGEHSIALAKYISSCPNMHCIVGNHELSFLQFYRATMQNATDHFDRVLKQLQSYFPTDGHLLDWALVDWLESLPFYIETEDFICVHAGVPVDERGYLLPLARVEIEHLVFDRRFKDPYFSHRSPKCVFFGHTITSAVCGENKILGYRRHRRTPPKSIGDYYKIHLDTGACTSGVMGCFCLETLKTAYVYTAK